MAKFAVVKKQTPEELRAALIDQYADLNGQASQIDKARREMRKQILSLMPAIPEGEKSVEIATANAVALLALGESTEVMPQALYAQDQSLFWMLVKVPVTALRTVVDGATFRALTRIVPAQAPELTVRKRQDK